MNDKKWLQFFTLLDDIVKAELGSWMEAREIVEKKAKENEGAENLEEFLSWFDED